MYRHALRLSLAVGAAIFAHTGVFDGAARAADCQETCLAGCPKTPGTFGTPQVDRGCVLGCLQLQCQSTLGPQSSSTADGAAIQTIELWLRSFIPINHEGNPGYMLPVPGNPAHTMIRDPSPVSISCYLTDQRGFSDEPSASARLGTHIVVKIGAQATITASDNPPSESVELSCETGMERCRKQVDTSRSNSGPVVKNGDMVRVHVHGQANNACFRLSPNIHYDGDFIIDLSGRSIRFEGIIGEFPAFEAYARASGGPIRRIFREPPVARSTVWSVPLSRRVETPSVKF